MKWLIRIALFLFLIILVLFSAFPGFANLPRTAYNYSRRSPVVIRWNGTGFHLPPPWFRLGKRDQVEGTVTFFRDHFPWSAGVFSSITFREPFAGNFSQNPQEGLRRWEQLNDSVWSVPDSNPKLIDHSYSAAHSANNEFRCTNTALLAGSEKIIRMDCIETHAGWRFEFEGRPHDADEALSILQKGS